MRCKTARDGKAVLREKEAVNAVKKEEDSNTRKKLKRMRQSEEAKIITMINNTLRIEAAA